MGRYKIATIYSMSTLAIGLATMCHELAHVLVGRLVGGTPTLMTATEVQGDFNSLSPGGFVSLGIAGFLVNAFFCVLGWWVLSWKPLNAEIRLLAWFFSQ